MMIELLDELDQLVLGIKETSLPIEEEDISQLVFNQPLDLLDPKEELSAAQDAPKSPVMVRDLSHELLKINKKNVEVEGKTMLKDIIKAPSVVMPPVSPLSLSRAEFAYYGQAEPIVQVDEPSDDPLIHRIRENYRNCHLHRHTSLPLSAGELLTILQRYRDDIDFASEDPDYLFLVPLGGTSVPKWIPPGSRFRLGRDSPWLTVKNRVVSRCHCEIFHDINTFYILDLDSSSGTFLNAQRLSEKFVPLQSGDILQLGISFTAEADELGNLPLNLQSVQAMVLLGRPTKATVELPNQQVDLRPSIRMDWRQLKELSQKVEKYPIRLEAANLRMMLQFCDRFHSDGAGLAVIFGEDGKLAYSALFNAYKGSWEAALTDAVGKSVSLLQVAPNCSSVYGVLQGGWQQARVTILSDSQLVVDPQQQPSSSSPVEASSLASPFSPSTLSLNEIPVVEAQEKAPFYILSGELSNGHMMHLIERSHHGQTQKLRGEIQLNVIKKRWSTKLYSLEARLAMVPEHESSLIHSLLLAVLLHLEKC